MRWMRKLENFCQNNYLNLISVSDAAKLFQMVRGQFFAYIILMILTGQNINSVASASSLWLLHRSQRLHHFISLLQSFLLSALLLQSP